MKPPTAMSESAIALEKMTDTGRFEHLATAILRRANPDYSSLIHTGVNAEGKPVNSPIDGLALIPGSSPPHFVNVQHTTEKKTKLRGKWLSKKGDIEKTVELIHQERQRDPISKLTLILTTNRTPSEDVIRDAHARARTLGITLDIWDRSRLSDFLDHTSDGQWLRHHYLGINQERLSYDLLAEISSKSAKDFQATVLDNPQAWIERRLDAIIQSRIGKGHSLTFIAMPSGMGKTTALSRYLTRWTEHNNLGLWVPAEIFQEALALDQAIDAILRMYAPELETNAGSIARAFGTQDKPLLLFIDDINRSLRPTTLIERLLAWHTNAVHSNLRIVCPVWPQMLEQLQETNRRAVEACAVLHNSFDDSEAIAALLSRATIAGTPLTHMRASEISKALGNDPLLIAITPPGAATGLSPTLVIPGFINQQIATCQTISPGNFISGDYHHALGSLAWEMLVRHNMTPRWNDITEWLGSRREVLDPLRNLIRQRTLCNLEGSADNPVFAFRHDRVRATVMATELCRKMQAGKLPNEVLSDPFYADFLGQALVQIDPSPDWIGQLKINNPLALFYALRVLEKPGTDFERVVVTAILAWLDSPEAKSTSTAHLQWAMQAVLAEMDFPVVRQIASHFHQPGWSLTYAKFRNGDLLQGASICYSMDPHINAPYRDMMIRHVMQREAALVEKLSEQLTYAKLTKKLRTGSLYLAGFVAKPELGDAIAACWQQFGKEPEHLPAFVWAACQCAGKQPESMLDPILDYWASLPERDENNNEKPHRYLVYDYGIQFGFARQPPIAALQYLIAQAKREELHWPIILLIEHIDHPDVAAFLAQERAHIARKVEKTGGFSPWLSISMHQKKNLLSEPSRERLREIWATIEADDYLREQAFELWSLHADKKELSLLPLPLPIGKLGERMLQLRIRLGDVSAIPEFGDKVRTDKHNPYWWQFVRGSWQPELLPLLDEEFARRERSLTPDWGKPGYESDWVVSKLTMEIPSRDAEGLLAKHWHHLRYDADFVQTALFVATPRCLALAAGSVNDSPSPEELFKYLDHHWRIGGRDENNRLTPDRLAALEPYLDLLSGSTIHDLWEACNVHSFHAWRRQHLDQRLTEEWRSRCHINDADLFAELDRLAEPEKAHWADHFLREFDERGDPPDRYLSILVKWLSDHGTIQALRVTAQCLALRGRRDDLRILDIPLLPSGAEADEIRADARFAVYRRSLV